MTTIVREKKVDIVNNAGEEEITANELINWLTRAAAVKELLIWDWSISTLTAPRFNEIKDGQEKIWLEFKVEIKACVCNVSFAKIIAT